MAQPDLRHSHARHVPAGGRSSVEELMPALQGGRRSTMRLRKIMLSLGWLAAMAVALGAGWKN
jgi:hypothetical protein